MQLVLTPQGSTNWLLDENILFNLLVNNISVFMDKDDLHRYRKLARKSDIDFLKYYLLSFLKANNTIKVVDYRALYPRREILDNVALLDRQSNLFLGSEMRSLESEVINGYERYLRYISNKERILGQLNNKRDWSVYEKERTTAEAHMNLIKGGKFENERQRSYVHRLCTKMMAAKALSDKLNAGILDSLEYLSGINILEDHGITVRPKFSTEIHLPNERYTKLQEFILRRKLIDEQSTIPIPVIMMKGLMIGQSSSLISILRNEVDKFDAETLTNEIIAYQSESIQSKDEQALISYAMSLLGAIYTPVSFIALYFGGLGVLPSNSFSSKYSLLSQLIANASRYEKSLERRKRRVRLWVRWFRGLFDSGEDDTLWADTQRSMDDWIRSDIYVPWYEDVA